MEILIISFIQSNVEGKRNDWPLTCWALAVFSQCSCFFVTHCWDVSCCSWPCNMGRKSLQPGYNVNVITWTYLIERRKILIYILFTFICDCDAHVYWMFLSPKNQPEEPEVYMQSAWLRLSKFHPLEYQTLEFFLIQIDVFRWTRWVGYSWFMN